MPDLAGIGAARRAIGRGREIGVAEAAIAALADHHALADLGHVGDQRLLVLFENLRADRHLQHGVGAAPAGAVLAHAVHAGLALEMLLIAVSHAVHAGLGLEMLLVAIVDQRVEPIDAFGDDIAAASAVAAVGTAEFDEFLAPERHAAGAAVAGAHVNLGLIEEFHRV